MYELADEKQKERINFYNIRTFTAFNTPKSEELFIVEMDKKSGIVKLLNTEEKIKRMCTFQLVALLATSMPLQWNLFYGMAVSFTFE